MSVVYSNQRHNAVAPPNGSSQSSCPSSTEKQHPSDTDTRATKAPEPLPLHTAISAGGPPPSDPAANDRSVTCDDSTSSPAHDGVNSAALPTQLEYSQRTCGASAGPEKVNGGGSEVLVTPQTSGLSAGAEGCPDGQESYQSKSCLGNGEGPSSRDREKDRIYPEKRKDKERHYRDKSQERDDDRRQYRRDSQYYHYSRSYRDRSPHTRSQRDWESSYPRERTVYHPRNRDRDKYSHHHHHWSREEWGREWRGQDYPYNRGSQGHWQWKEKHRDFRAMKEKASGKETYEYSSKSQTASTTAVSETFTHSKGSPARTSLVMPESASDRKDPNCKRTPDDFSMERESSHDARQAKKHKRSKKKKLKDRERHRDSGWVYGIFCFILISVWIVITLESFNDIEHIADAVSNWEN